MGFDVTSSADDNFLKVGRRDLKGEEKWRDIADLINRWAKRNPAEAFALQKHILELKSVSKDSKYGFIDGPKKVRGAGGGGTRLGIALMPSLLQYIEFFYPDFLKTKDELHEFEKRFPKFLVPESV